MPARIIPFALYFVFVGLDEGLRFLVSAGFATIPTEIFLFLYPVKISVVIVALWYFRTAYTELNLHDLSQWQYTIFSTVMGIIVFVLWIKMTWTFAVFGTVQGYNPTAIQQGAARIAVIASRLFGASIVVPAMEELFWRSFIVRYIIKPDFEKVQVGYFTLASFVISAILFGIEHNLWLAGIMAGVVYNFVLYKTKSIAQCILAHAVTNGSLGVYVLSTQSWYFW
jgi:CAAX prenyl protease-like protein